MSYKIKRYIPPYYIPLSDKIEKRLDNEWISSQMCKKEMERRRASYKQHLGVSVLSAKYGVAASSKNLEIIGRYARAHGGVTRVTIQANPIDAIFINGKAIYPIGRGRLRLTYGNGNYTVTDFASYDVLRKWCMNKTKGGIFSGITIEEI